MTALRFINDALLPEGSLLGKQKLRLFMENRVICAEMRNSTPWYRLSWERLHMAITDIEEQMVEHLRGSEDGERKVAEYLALPRLPVIVAFLDSISGLLTASLRDYNSAWGFDLDIFLFMRAGVPIIRMEIFPRKGEGIFSTAYTSALRDDVPLVQFRTNATASAEDSVYDNSLIRFIFNGPIWGGGLDVRNPILRTFSTEKGIWPVTNQRIISELILYTALSVMESGTREQRPIIAVESWMDLERMHPDARLHLGSAGPPRPLHG